MRVHFESISASKKAAIAGNIFPDAIEAVEPFEDFPWHKNANRVIDADHPRSSQALAIDVLGTIRQSPIRAVLLNGIAREFGIEAAPEWTLDLEWADEGNRLHEIRHGKIDARTRLDALAQTCHSVVSFECKFTEPGGPCSQANPPQGRKPQCDGNYVLAIDSHFKGKERCTLTAKGITYWGLIPGVFKFNAEQDHHPCPFSGEEYQFMRMIVLPYAVAAASNRKATAVVVYADGPFPTAQLVRSRRWQDFRDSVQSRTVSLYTLSYQKLVEICITQCHGHTEHQQVLLRLREWVRRKIELQAGATRWPDQ